MAEPVDLIVIGAGAGGLTAAREGVRRGADTVLISDGPPGGDCTFTGCVPSKTLLAAAGDAMSFTDAMARVSHTVSHIAATEDATALEGAGIRMVTGRGSFVSSDTVAVEDRSSEDHALGGDYPEVNPFEAPSSARRPIAFSAPRIVIATGSTAAIPPVDGLSSIGALTNANVFDLKEPPQRLAILGGGPVGCELAFAFAGFGVEVTVSEMASRLLPRDEPEASAVARRTLESRGVTVHTDTTVTSARSTTTGARLLSTSVHAGGSAGSSADAAFDDATSVEADRVLIAAGRSPVTAGLRAERAGVLTDRRGAITVDDTMATTAPGIWAIGDVTGGMAFTHAAGRMALIAVHNAFASRVMPRQHFDRTQIPWVTFLDPEIAHVGMTENEAARHGGRVAWLPLSEVDRALTSGRTDGFVKLIAGPRPILRNAGGGRLLGATIVAPRAGEMIHEVAIAMRTKAFTGRLAQTVHAYPSWSIAVQDAAAQFFTTHRGHTARPARPVPPRRNASDTVRR